MRAQCVRAHLTDCRENCDPEGKDGPADLVDCPESVVASGFSLLAWLFAFNCYYVLADDALIGQFGQIFVASFSANDLHSSAAFATCENR